MKYSAPPVIPIARPRLPSADEVLPFLREIDATRHYTNGGPLNARLEQALGQRFGAERSVLCHSSCTIGLVAALLALRPEPGALCMMPSWSFPATGHAARLAGLTPWFVDVEAVSGALTPALARAALAQAPARVAAVTPVMPFGAPIDTPAWEGFRDETGLPVIVDGAAAFDSLSASTIPIVVSLHATKLFGVGEGGFTLCRDATFLRTMRKVLNFGFHGTRNAELPAVNGKLSEYAAALGLAALPGYGEKRKAHRKVAQFYLNALPDHITMPAGFGTDWVSASLSVSLPAECLAPAKRALARRGIAWRHWWEAGMHRMPAFATCPRLPLPVTEALARSTLGVPFYQDLSAAQVQGICAALAEAGS